MLYVYALLSRQPSEPPGAGMLGEPLQLIACGGLLAVAGEMGSVPPLSSELLRGHEFTVRRLAAAAAAILPARFGSLARDVRMLADLLSEREAQLADALRLVEGCEQMTLRIYGPLRGSAGNSSAGPMGIAAVPLASGLKRMEPGGPGAHYLAGKLRERQMHEEYSELPELEQLRIRLDSCVKAQRVRHHHGGGALRATVYHLIERGRSAAYLARLAACASPDGALHPAASGPWPPYAFGPEWL